MTDLPQQFDERVRPDIVKRAVLSIQSNNRQKYGTDPEAGLRHVTYWKKRNNAYRGQKGRGQSRTPRKIVLSRGSQIFGEGAEAPNTRGGRKAHGPSSEKDFTEEINNKERRKGIRSAITATTDQKLVSEHHSYDGELPLIEELEDIEKTSELKDTLEELGLEEELERCSEKKVRSGKGKNRGRKYRRKTGPLLVVADDNGILDAASNLPGVEVSRVENLNAEKLSSGVEPGRLTVWTPKSIKRMKEKQLFV